MSIDDDTLTSFAQDNVARGAALLDAVRPGWHTRIDISALALYTCDRCVLGQLFGGDHGFYLGMTTLAPPDEQNTITWAVDHGFETDRDGEFAVLTQAWVDAIEERRWTARPGNLQAVTS